VFALVAADTVAEICDRSLMVVFSIPDAKPEAGKN
jgi:hypothetical protein